MKPFPEFQNVILFRNNIGNSSYNGLYVKMEKRFSRGLTFLVSYTHSKLIDDASSVFDASLTTGSVANFPVADSFNRRLERDVSSGDIPNVTAISSTYDLPIGPGHDLHPEGIAGKFTNGWQLAGIVSIQSGLPLAVTQTTNFNAIAGFATQRPTCVAATSSLPLKRTTAEYFNTAAFQITPQFQIGTCSRNPVRGPAYRDADIAVIKRTPIRRESEHRFPRRDFQSHKHAATRRTQCHRRQLSLRHHHLGRRPARRATRAQAQLLGGTKGERRAAANAHYCHGRVKVDGAAAGAAPESCTRKIGLGYSGYVQRSRT